MKISSYLFDFIQMITYVIICWDAKLYLEFGEQIFYFVACIFGVFLWKKNMKKNDGGTEQVIAKKFNPWHWVATVVVTVVSTFLLGACGKVILGSTLPYIDEHFEKLFLVAHFYTLTHLQWHWQLFLSYLWYGDIENNGQYGL